jgi:sortase A
MPNQRRDTSSERVRRPLRRLERLLVVSGVAALIWCAGIVADREIAQRRAQSALEIATAVEELTDAAPVAKADVLAPPSPVAVGSAIAALSIPRVQLSAMVLHGSDARTLQRGPGHLEYTALPGSAGNVVIAGHRDSFFRPLRHIRLGDDIFLETRDGRFHYRVTSLRVVGPHEISVLAPTGGEVLTLITCYPFWVLGRAPDRFIVRAARVADHRSASILAWSLPVLDWTHAPVLETVSASESISAPITTPPDDESLVREAVTRYLLAQGVRLTACEVSINGDWATADCPSDLHSPIAQKPYGRLFSLERANHAWPIRSIELRH